MAPYPRAPVEALPAVSASQFEVSAIRALRGPNYWRLAPVIACDVRLGSLESADSAAIPDFHERLMHLLPSLDTQPCAQCRNGRLVDALREGITLPHVLEHVALELQTLAGSEVAFGRVARSGNPDVWWVIVAYEEEDVGVASVREGARVVRTALAPDAEPALDIHETIRSLHALNEEVRLGPSTWVLVEEARRRGIPVRRLNSGSLVQFGLGRNLRRIQATLTDFTSAIGVEVAQNKDETKRVLRDIGLPVPEGGAVSSVEDAVQLADDVGYPVILKPLDASHGRGVSGRLENAEALTAAWDTARAVGSEVIVERFHPGRDHRVLVVGGRAVASAERVPAHVMGDGTSTIAQLIVHANLDPRRGHGHRKSLTYLPHDVQTLEFIARLGHTIESVPADGERVMLRATANLSTGGTSIDRTDDMHPDNIAACEMAVGVIGLDVAGVDIITDDISVPFRDNDAVMLEINAAPGLRMHTHPAEGAPRHVASPIMDLLYAPGAPATIPVIAVTGTNGKTTTVRLLAHLFRNVGERVGYTTTDGVYLDDRLVMEGDMSGPFGANIVLTNPTVSVAIVETARGGLLRAGLGFDECDVGVMLNISGDHLGLGGINTPEQLSQLKGVVVAAIRRDGHAVLNADDPLVYALRERTASDVVLFSARDVGESAPLEMHARRGGICACMNAGQFLIRRGRLQIPIAHEHDVPLMIGGAARFQRQNVLAAIATAYARGMRYDDIHAGLVSFVPSTTATPGRLNVVALASGGHIVIDYAHNDAAVEGLVDFVRRFNARRRVIIAAMPGDRRDEDIRAVGRRCAEFDHVIVKEDQDLRGRQPGETPSLLVEGLRQGGLTGDRVQFIPDELEALRRGIELVGQGELLVIMVDKVRRVLTEVEQHARGES